MIKVRLASAKSEAARNEILKEILKQKRHLLNFKIMKPSSLNFMKSWQYTGLLEVFRLKDFQSDFRWVAKRFGLPVKKVKEVFLGLQSAGIIDKNESGLWRKMEKHEKWPDVPSKSIRKIHKEYMTLALKAVEDQRFTDRDISGSVFAISRKQYPQLQKLISEFRQKAIQLADEEQEPDSIYRLSVQLFRLDKEGLDT